MDKRTHVDKRTVAKGPLVRRQVDFVDWGNGELVPGNKVRAIDVSLKALEPQAHFYALAYLKVRPGPRRARASPRPCSWPPI